MVGGQADLQATAERGAVDGGDDRLGEELEPAQCGLDALGQAKTSAASSLVVCTIGLRSPPAKKVFFALAMTTPVTVVLLVVQPVDGCLHRRM